MDRTSNRTLIENAWIVFPLTLVHSAIYRFLTKHSLMEPWVLESTWLDGRIPFLLWTVWPYLAMVIVCITAPLCIRDRIVFRRYVASYVAAVSLLLIFYCFFPTAIRRMPKEADATGWSWFVYRQFAEGLGTACAFPSGHIVFPMIGCWALYRDRLPAAKTIAVLTAFSSISILSIKEHVAWDWLGGLVVGMVAIAISERWSPRIAGQLDQHVIQHDR